VASLSPATSLLAQQSRALLTRLGHVQPFALREPSVPAAALAPDAQTAIDRHLASARRRLRREVERYLRWLHQPEGAAVAPEVAQQRFTFLKLRFNALLVQLDIFAAVFSQRGEHETGVWLAGLDAAATDALALDTCAVEMPAIVCYLDRGHGGAIRRARTRLPGGGRNPVAIVRIPRERMVGSSVASSLVHEVGHQGAALLRLVQELQPLVHGLAQQRGRASAIWRLWGRWISEIVADLWSIARVGVASTLGLISLVSLPRPFVFRISFDDPHPVPWIRVKLSCAIGESLYPDPQWARLADLWESLYPLRELDPVRRALIDELSATLPALVGLLVHHRPRALAGASLGEALASPARSVAELRALAQTWRRAPGQLRHARPIVAFAVIGQAQADGSMTPEEESRALSELLTYWALRRTLSRREHMVPHAVAA
jgi:hypothetical protein